VLAAPEQLAVENKGRHAKNPDLFGGAAYAFEFLPALLDQIDGKAGGSVPASVKTAATTAGSSISSSRLQKRSKTAS